MRRSVVLGVDSSTQSTKIIALDLENGQVLAEARAPHSGASTQHPSEWWTALVAATRQVAANDFDIRGIAVDGQQHGLVTLDAAGEVVRPASLWNNVEAAAEADRLNEQADFAREAGSKLVASFTIAKLAHVATTAPDDLARTAAVCLPHDWLSFRLTGNLASDRGDTSGTGWWSPITGAYRRDLLALAVGEDKASALQLPAVAGPEDTIGGLKPDVAQELGLAAGIAVGPGSGDNMAAALGIGASVDELVISLGTSGTAFAVSETPTADPSGEVCGFADATGRFLPLACLINCTRVVDAIAELVGSDRQQALDEAASTDPGAGGLLFLPYLGGERTPNLPDATGSFSGLTLSNANPRLLVRAALDGVAAGLAYCQEALEALGIRKPQVTLVGGGSTHPAWQQAIADVSALPVTVRAGGEHAARGAALQAAAIVRGEPVRALIERWRPAVLAEIEPRAGARAAFRLIERRDLITHLSQGRPQG